MTASEKLLNLLAKANIRTRRVKVYGSIAHIDSYSKYHDKIVDLMTSAGFSVLKVSDGVHMDGSEGYRASFQA